MLSEADDSDTDEEYKDSEDNHDSAEARPGVFYNRKGRVYYPFKFLFLNILFLTQSSVA